MMRALLAKKAALNITKRMKVEQDCSFEGIGTCYSYLSTSTIGNSQVGCFNSDNGFVFARPAKVTPKNGNAVEGAYMVVGGCYLIEFPSNFDIDKEALDVGASILEESEGYSRKDNYYLVTKKEADLNLKVKVEYTNIKPVEWEPYYDYDAVIETDSYWVFNPNKFSAEADLDDDTFVLLGKENRLTKSNPKVSDLIIAAFRLGSNEQPDLAGKDSYDKDYGGQRICQKRSEY